MRRQIAFLLAGLCLCTIARTARPQEQSFTLLRQAAHCLVASKSEEKKLLKGNPKTLSLGYFLDTSSYPGEEALYLVNYEGSNMSKGQAFVFFVADRDRRRVFRLENNASFMRKKKGIEFVDPPLGGVWTQEHFESAIERIEQDPKMEVVVKDLRGNFPDVRCESYSDAR
jgi:hypothetical protein